MGLEVLNSRQRKVRLRGHKMQAAKAELYIFNKQSNVAVLDPARSLTSAEEASAEPLAGLADGAFSVSDPD